MKLEEKFKFLIYLFSEKIDERATADLLMWYLITKERRSKKKRGKIEDIINR